MATKKKINITRRTCTFIEIIVQGFVWGCKPMIFPRKYIKNTVKIHIENIVIKT